MEKPSLQVCPSCKQKSLMFNQGNNKYECLNTKCFDSFSAASINRYIQQIAEDKKVLETLSNTETKSWWGDNYWDPKTKKWRAGKKPIRVRWTSNRWNWLFLVLAFIAISVVITLILNHFYPGSRFAIFWW